MITPFDLEVCRRLPLADATLKLVRFVLDDSFLAGVFTRHRGRTYEKAISFPTIVRLISDSLFGHRGSAHQNFKKSQQEDTLDASIQAVYGKLRRVPLPLSLGLFAEAAARLRLVAPLAPANPLPASLREFWCLAIDGKKIKYVAKKLGVLRGLKGNVFGGKMLCAQDMATQEAIAVEAVADGEAGDNPLVPGLVTRVRTLGDSRPRLWVADRAFCDYKCLALFCQGGDHFVVRYQKSFKFHLDSSIPVRKGTDDVGRPTTEEWGWLGTGPGRVCVRKITAEREGEPFVVVTSTLDGDRYPAIDILTLYRSRWGIESMYQEVVETFGLRELIGSTPEATTFQAMLCLLIYNITLTIRHFVAAGAKVTPQEVSVDLLFDDVRRDLTGCLEVLGAEATTELFETTHIDEPSTLAEYLAALLKTIWTDRWKKAQTRKQPPKTTKGYLQGGHSSVFKIQRGLHTVIPPKPKAEAGRSQ